jgi:hypothetical protein
MKSTTKKIYEKINILNMTYFLIYSLFKNKKVVVEKRAEFGIILIYSEKKNMDMLDVYIKHVAGRELLKKWIR